MVAKTGNKRERRRTRTAARLPACVLKCVFVRAAFDSRETPLGNPVGRVDPRIVGRYAIYGEIASGGMASVHFARLTGPSGFARTVAIKRAHPHLARDADFALMFLDEARLASRIRHSNVVSTIDVLNTPNELVLVMDYVHGESLWRLVRAAAERNERVPAPIAATILI